MLAKQRFSIPIFQVRNSTASNQRNPKTLHNNAFSVTSSILLQIAFDFVKLVLRTNYGGTRNTSEHINIRKQ